MTVAELIVLLGEMPQDVTVVITESHYDDLVPEKVEDTTNYDGIRVVRITT